MSSSPVYKGRSRTVGSAAETIVQAFLHDPFNMYFYNLLPDPMQPPPDTAAMMAIHVRNAMLTELVLTIDDNGRECASVAMWEPPRETPLGWLNWSLKRVLCLYEAFMGYYYYRNRGVNRTVIPAWS
jgi:hypothetical protein